jgi:hypothetical protein
MSCDQFLDLTTKHRTLVHGARIESTPDATNTQTFRDLTEKNKQLQTAYDNLKAAQAQLIEKERLERELQVAADIQLSILPDELPELDEFSFGARILPARQVGGDLYDVFLLKDNQVGVLIGDVADKGVPSAIFMARAHALIWLRPIGMTAEKVLQWSTVTSLVGKNNPVCDCVLWHLIFRRACSIMHAQVMSRL